MAIIDSIGLKSLALFGSFGWQELLIILFIVLLIFGPKNLPKLGRIFGKSVKEFRGAASQMSESMQDEDDKPEKRDSLPQDKRDSSRSSEHKEKHASP